MSKKRNFSSLVVDSPDSSQSPFTTPASQNKKRRLRRLPHVFSKVLELPLSSDADVSVEDLPDCFRFVAKADSLVVVVGGGGLDVWAHMIEVHPGVKKVLVRRRCGDVDDQMGLDMWRVRLPDNAWLETTKVVCGGGQLIVTVPKKSGGGGREWVTMDNLVVVQ